jgi:cytidylate kinase
MLAKRLAYTHIDTGALYRGVAWLAIKAQVSLSHEASVIHAAQSARFEFRQLPEGNLLHVNGQCVHQEIRTEEVSAAASKVSAYPGVRSLLLGLQRDLGKNGGVVLEGRDIGTVVFPHAEVKIFLTASVETRAKRRVLELSAKGEMVEMDRVKADMIVRDKQDSEREIAPLKQAIDAVPVDTSDLSIESVLDRLESLVRSRA